MRFSGPNRSRPDAAALVGLAAAYMLIALLTGLSWPLFRDEPIYLDAARSFARGLPGAAFDLGVSRVAVAIWGTLIRLGADTPAALRGVTLLAALGSLLAAARLARRARAGRPLLIAALLGSLPELFVYSFQINGSLPAVLLGYGGLLAWLRARGTGSPFALLSAAALFVLGALQNPFSLGYPAAAALAGMARWRRAEAPGDRRAAVREAVVFSGAVLAWLACVGLGRPGIAGIIARHAPALEVNRSVLGFLYPGNVSVALAFLGGMFPFLGRAVPRKLPARVWRPLVLGAVALAALFLPRTGSAYHDHFHTIFTMGASRVVGAAAGPAWIVTGLFFGLVALGTFNLAHVVWLGWRRPYGGFFLLASGLSLVGLLVDGYISARLALPGLLGCLFLAQSMVAAHPGTARLQLAYQLLWCGVYAGALGLKHGFLGL